MISGKHPDEVAFYIIEIEHTICVSVAGCPEEGLTDLQTSFQIETKQLVLLRNAKENFAVGRTLRSFADESI